MTLEKVTDYIGEIYSKQTIEAYKEISRKSSTDISMCLEPAKMSRIRGEMSTKVHDKGQYKQYNWTCS